MIILVMVVDVQKILIIDLNKLKYDTFYGVDSSHQ